MVDVKDTTLNFVHELDNLPLGGEFFDGDFASDEGNEINERVRLQKTVYGWRELVKSGLIPPQILGYGLKFLGGRWECGIFQSERSRVLC